MRTLSMTLTVALVALVLAAARPAGAAINLMVGIPYVANNGGFTDFGSNPPGAMSDGNNNTGMYVNWSMNSSVDYDLGANYDVDAFGVVSGSFQGRNHPQTVVLDFFSDPGFTTLATTRTVTPLADLDYATLPFPVVTNARYIRFTTPAGSEWTTGTDTSWGWVGELQLFEFQQIPEPNTVALLALGGLILRRSRRNG